MTNKRISRDALLIAIYCVLSSLTPIKITNFKLTFEAFPILVAAIMFGPKDGLIVGTIGSFIYQLFLSGYGISATTILWILPHSLSGLVVGLYAKKYNFKLTFKQICFITIVSSILVTTLNSIVLYIDSLIYGYYFKGLIMGSIIIKVLVGIISSIIYSLIMPRLINFLKEV